MDPVSAPAPAGEAQPVKSLLRVEFEILRGGVLAFERMTAFEKMAKGARLLEMQLEFMRELVGTIETLDNAVRELQGRPRVEYA